MTQKLNISIVGGGIAGLSLAVGVLSRQKNAPEHVKITIYEAAKQFSEIGAGLGIGPNAYRTLKLLNNDLFENYKEICEYRDIWFQWRKGAETEPNDTYNHKLIGQTVSQHGQTSVHRARFLDILVSLLPKDSEQISFKFCKRLVGYEEMDSSVTLKFEDGSLETCDILIAADGVKSNVRKALYATEKSEQTEGIIEPRFTGTYCYRGVIPMENAIEAVGEKQARISQMFLGVDKHILTFPLDNNTKVNIVAFKTDRSLPVGQRVWPPDDWKENNIGNAANGWVVNVNPGEMKEDFSDWGAGVQRLLDCIQNPSRWALHELIELPYYYKGRVVLIGDAAHGCLPHAGAGAGQGIEDALILATLLANPMTNNSNIDNVLSAYDKIRRPRASNVQTSSRNLGDIYEFTKYGDGQENELAEILQTWTQWIWNHDIEGDIEKAQQYAFGQ